MFTWLGSKFTAILSTYVLGVVSALMTAIAPIALSAMTLWVLLYGWAVLRNEVPETVPSFLWKVTKIGLVLAFALQSGVYIANVADTANGSGDGCRHDFPALERTRRRPSRRPTRCSTSSTTTPASRSPTS